MLTAVDETLLHQTVQPMAYAGISDHRFYDRYCFASISNDRRSGFFAGMSLAIITGHCYQNFWAQIGESTPIAEATTLLLGVRDLSPAAERERLHHSAMQVVNWHEGKPRADVLACLDTLGKRVQEVYLHIDLDVFDPQVAPGLVDDPVPGGLSMPQMEEAIRTVAARFRLRAVALATYNPDRDQEEKTLRAGLRILDLLAECADKGK